LPFEEFWGRAVSYIIGWGSPEVGFKQIYYNIARITNQNSFHEVKSRLNLENVCCHSVQNLLPFSPLSKNEGLKYTQLHPYAGETLLNNKQTNTNKLACFPKQHI
jgi:hypothetical protein